MTSEHDKRSQGTGLQHEAVALEHAAERLSERFPEVPKEEIDQLVEEHYEQYEDASVRDFVPVLVEHDVRSELDAETGEAE